MPNGKDIIRRYDNLRTAAANHFTRCESMAKYISPSRVGINTKRSPGANLMDDVYDSTAMFAADLLAKYIAGEVINPAQRWHRWKLRKPKGEDQKTEADEWIEECTDRALQQRSDSNFYAEAPEMLVDYGGFGTGCLMGDERKDYREDSRNPKKGFRGLRFQTTKTGRFVIAEDEEGKVNGCWREYSVSAQAAADRWGKDNLPREMKDALPGEGRTGDPDKQFDVVHCVYPRDKSLRSEYKGAKGYPFVSCWTEKKSCEIIEESGYRRFPFMVPRWEKTPGEVFGRGPGDRAFPDVRTLNQAKKMGLEDWALKIRPPIIVANDSVIGSIRIRPATYTTLRVPPGGDVRKAMAPWETGSHPEISQIKEDELRRQIKQLFFVDQILQMLQVESTGGSKPQMTAEEWRGKMNLLFKILGSVYGRMESEFLIPETELTFALMYDAGAFPPEPPELKQRRAMGEDLAIDVEFTSPIALAQKIGDVDAIRAVYGDIAALAMGDMNRAQRLLQNFDDDENIRLIAERRGMPERGILSEEDRDKIRDEIMKKQQQDAQMQQVMAGSEALKNAAPLIAATRQGQAA